MTYGYLRASCASPDLKVADIDFNVNNICSFIKQAQKAKTEVLVFPELCITGYTCADLFFQDALQKMAITGLIKIANQTKDFNALVFVGLPLAHEGKLFNCAVALHKGKILAAVPKTFVPNYQEFYERRWFTPYSTYNKTLNTQRQNAFVYISPDFPCVPFGTNILFCDKNNPDIKIATEICEDLWVAAPPSTQHAQAGAIVIANLSASNEIIAKQDYRRDLVKIQSGRLLCSYLYANAGTGESTTDLVFSGHSIIAQNGAILKQSTLFKTQMITSDIDCSHLLYQRKITSTFATDIDIKDTYTQINIDFVSSATPEPLEHKISCTPFVPQDTQKRKDRCSLIIELQAQGLAKRLRHTEARNIVLGLSGGLDSTLALLVAKKAFDIVGLSLQGIKAVTMPCFGTTKRTLHNAKLLAQTLEASLLEIPIKKAVKQHFLDIRQSLDTHDVTYENSQARERTQVLMDLANKYNALVIGTGDLSELALGWATYNGDHISMYGVNSSIPKTLVRHLIQYFCDTQENKTLKTVLKDILDTPVSPELLPPLNGQISQNTENLVGPYLLHDFFLYHFLRYGTEPKKIFFLACNAFLRQGSTQSFSKDDILKWEKVFFKRFFANQFKRSCLPDGAKVGTVNLSPRGDYRMPSDACVALWQKQLEELC